MPVKTQYKSDTVNTIIKTVVSVSSPEKVFLNVIIWKIIIPNKTLNQCFSKYSIGTLSSTSSSWCDSISVLSISFLIPHLVRIVPLMLYMKIALKYLFILLLKILYQLPYEKLMYQRKSIMCI